MSGEECIMCKQNIDDHIQFGEKITFEDITAHYFCLLLSSNLGQNGEDDDGIFGFMPADIKKEAKRAKIQRCMFCHENGANISCCAKKCRKTFHFTCGSQRNCHFEFIDPFKSYCERHSNFEEPEECHQSTDLCIICSDPMGEYNAVKSIQTPCCKKWSHRFCLQKCADRAGYFCKCPTCNDSKRFRAHIAKRGVFIPDRDALWEETGTNTFYEFSKHVERPKECIAENCGLSGDVEIELLLCEYCGSQGVHKCCLGKSKHFICDDCRPPPSKRRKLQNGSYESVEFKESNGWDKSIIGNQDHINNNIPLNDSSQKNALKNIHELTETYEQFPYFIPYKLKFRLPNSIKTDTTDALRNITKNDTKRIAEI